MTSNNFGSTLEKQRSIRIINSEQIEENQFRFLIFDFSILIHLRRVAVQQVDFQGAFR